MKNTQICLQKILILFTILVFIFTFTFTACGNSGSGDPSSPAHTHEWGNWVTDVQVTVSSVGTDKRTCSVCGVSEFRNVQWFELGAEGPGKGKIFYRSEAGFIMTDTGDIAHYLEVAPADLTPPLLQWASSSFMSTRIDGTQYDIGTGRKNTTIILATDNNAPAAAVCNNYNGNGKNDWFLPSREELFELFNVRDSLFDN